MPPPHRAQRRRTQAPVTLPRARLARAMVACAMAGLSAAIPLGGPGPLAGAAAASTTAGQPVGAPPVSVVISSMNPGYASPGRAVTVRGTVTNASAAPLRGLSIRLSLSSQAFSSRDALQAYATGASVLGSAVPGAAAAIRHTLNPRATARWSVRLPASQIRMTRFGVYPLAATAVNSIGATLDASRTFLPYWAADRARDPLRQQVAWIWPLVDQPRTSACPGPAASGLAASLVNDGLAASLGGGGRLSALLTAGAAYAAQAHLTWAIDPALLANARTMTSPYLISGNGQCQGAVKPASPAAATWLAGLKSAISGQPVFVTPYADVDAVALVHKGLNGDLTAAFTAGRSVASTILGRDFGSGHAAAGGDSHALEGLSWPPNGIADYTTLQSLAGVDGISSVILDSTIMPPLASWPPTPSAQTTTPDGEGADLHVLLADHTITAILGSASTAPRSPAAALSIRQYYLAETAMIAAEAPSVARSIVVAPPSRWDPPASVARGLLAETVSAPWLRPVSVARLTAAKSAPGQVRHKLVVPARTIRSGLSRSLLRRVRELDKRVQLLQSIRVRPDTALSLAVAAAESAAWQGRGAASRPGGELLGTISSYVSAQESGLTLISPGRVTLGGLQGTVPVSITSHLGYPVLLRLQVSTPRDGALSVRSQPGVIRVAASTVKTIKLKVSTAAVGSTTLRLSLLTPAGKPLPDLPVTMTVQATHYGTLALVIIAAALGVFMLTSATRAIRRGRGAPDRKDDADHGAVPGHRPGGDDEDDQEHQAGGSPRGGGSPRAAGSPGPPGSPEFPGSPEPAGPPGPAGPRESAASPQQPGQPQKADNVESGRTGKRGRADADDLEDADEYARAPGRADRH